MRRDSIFCAKSVRYNIFVNGTPYKRFKLCMNSTCFGCNFQARYPIVNNGKSKVSSKALQSCKTDSKDFALAVHVVRQKESIAAPVRSKLSLILSNKSVHFGEN